jgi:hypothetical protein
MLIKSRVEPVFSDFGIIRIQFLNNKYFILYRKAIRQSIIRLLDTDSNTNSTPFMRI